MMRRPCNVPGNIIFLKILLFIHVIWIICDTVILFQISELGHIFIYTEIIQDNSKVYMDYFQIKRFVTRKQKAREQKDRIIRGNTWITRWIMVATFANMTVSRCALSVGCNSGL